MSMAQTVAYAPPPPAATASNVPSVVIGPQFCVPYPTHIVVSRKGHSFSNGNFVVTDVNDNIIFKVKRTDSVLHSQRLLLDAADNPIVTLREKILSEHYRWRVFRGDSKEKSNLIFSSKTPHMVQTQSNINVYLANNREEKSSDFKVVGSWSHRNSTVYLGEDSTQIIAQMHMGQLEGSSRVVLGKDKFMVTISPNVDYAFIVALIVILEATSHNMALSTGMAGVNAGVAAFVVADTLI